MRGVRKIASSPNEMDVPSHPNCSPQYQPTPPLTDLLISVSKEPAGSYPNHFLVIPVMASVVMIEVPTRFGL